MDILEQHLEEQDASAAKDDGTGVVLEEGEVVDCEEEPVVEDEMRYQEALNVQAYRVVQVNGTPVQSTNEVELSSSQSGNNTVQVLAAPLNGPFYVIGNPSDVFTTAQTSRSLPRTIPTTLQIETQRNCTSGFKKRDDKRRATHNEVERRRRDKINNWITKLGKIIPECNTSATTNGNSGESKPSETPTNQQSKGGILAKACEYIGELRMANQNLNQCLQDNEKLRQEILALKQLVTQLKQENLQLKSQVSSISSETGEEVVQLSP